MTDRAPWGAVMYKQAAQAASVHACVLPWLEQAAQHGGVHGGDLTEMLAACCPHPEQAVDDLLKWWLEVGLLGHAKLSNPSPSQRFLGHGGVGGAKMGVRKAPPSHPPCWFDWARVGPIWLRGSG